MANRWGNVETVSDFTFLSSKINADGDGSHKIKRCLPLGRIAMTNLDSVLKSRDIILLTVSHNQSYDFSSTHVWIWELDHEEGWVLKNWHFQTVVLEKTLQCPLGSKETKPVNPKGNQSLNIHWKDCCWSSNILAIWCEELTHWKKTLMLGKIEGKRKGATEDEMVGLHHWLNFEQTQGDSDGLRSLACCSARVAKSQTRLGDWPTTIMIFTISFLLLTVSLFIYLFLVS